MLIKSLYTTPSRPEPHKTVGCYSEYATSQLGSVLHLNKRLVCLLYHTPRWWSCKCLLTHSPLSGMYVIWCSVFSPFLLVCWLLVLVHSVTREDSASRAASPHLGGKRQSYLLYFSA